ncbi:DNA recombination protein RmuC [Roseibaca sp. V10]|uniref:DNA recombination protein RmuC homolog n=1 Tax=Roseinatronobacter domitianus TaxID=2940293 RepID=A0ABT0M517_9RHOB|nr:DNA recombination protein RmuC [Roseibaca domitiana]MCL1629485.1 DNA recombination protein RmuC [Roseibaca domitiana]
MTEFSDFSELIGRTDPVLVGLGLLGLLVLVLSFRRPKDGSGPLRDALVAREAELRDALNGANRAEALAEERKTEVDRLNGDLSKLRIKLDEDAQKAREDASRISALDTELRGEREEAEAAQARFEISLRDRETQADTLRGQVRDLTAAGTAKSEEISTLKSRISQLEADLRAAEALAKTTATRTSETLTDLRAQITERDGQVRDLRGKLDQAGAEKQALTGQVNKLQAELKAQGEAAAEKIEILSRVRADMEAKFGELAREALKVQGEAFSATNIERLNATLTPLKEHVGHFERELKAVHQATVDDRAALKAEIRNLTQRSEDISKEATALTRALKSDQQKQGAWGEMILANILERSGLREGEEYETQAHRTGTDGERLRPDVVVRIPGGKSLVVDSKVSLVAYTDAVNAETEEEAAAARKRHVASIRSHINGLSAKAYQAAEEFTVDYVILFVPIEGALSEALREDGALTEYALERHITIATPTTLMMALRTVSHVWAVERRNRNAEEIAKRAGFLYDKVVGFVSSMEGVGTRLRQAQDSYDVAIGQLSQGSGNLLRQTEMLKELGAKTTKSIGMDFDQETGSEMRASEGAHALVEDVVQ